MKYQIIIPKKTDKALYYALERLPQKIQTSILKFAENEIYSQINEIRLHSNSNVSLIVDSRNKTIDCFVTEAELQDIASSLCDDSIYAHYDTIKDGYISVGKGIRAGICGRASMENGKIKGISNISSINIRLPKRYFHSADYLYDFLEKNNFSKSVILYSMPGIGKTTILRELIYKLSNRKNPIRNAVIDTREEITPFMEDIIGYSDVFISYPKGLAIELATKSMTPEIIICDEISSKEDADAILKAVNSGVKLIATAHASCFSELLSKEILKDLFNNNVFDCAIGIKRKIGSKKYEFTLNSIEKSEK
jgi:stage III sporulation protein AA